MSNTAISTLTLALEAAVLANHACFQPGLYVDVCTAIDIFVQTVRRIVFRLRKGNCAGQSADRVRQNRRILRAAC